MRQASYKVSSLKGPRMCGRYATNGFVTIRLNADVAHFAHTIRCGSAHSCAVCAPKIAAHRADDISARARAWMDDGNSLLAGALTFPHNFGMPLGPMYDATADGWRQIIKGRPWRRLVEQYGIAGYWRSIETTHGVNGWHPHVHLLIAVRGGDPAEALAAIDAHLRRVWSAWMLAHGYRAPSDEHGVLVEPVISAKAAGEYIAKVEGHARPVGNEIARADLKSGRKDHRTPLQILDDYEYDRDPADLALWHEHERVTYRRKRITESKSLRDACPPINPELTDEQIVEQEIGGEDIAEFPADEWALTLAVIPGLPGQLLTAAENGGRAAVHETLLGYGYTLACSFPPTRRRP